MLGWTVPRRPGHRQSSNLLVVLAHFRVIAQVHVDGLEHGLHHVFRRRAFAYDHELRLVRRRPHQAPCAVCQHDADAVYRDQFTDGLPGQLAAVRGNSLKVRHGLFNDAVFCFIGAVRRHGRRSPRLGQVPVQVRHGLFWLALQHAQNGDGGCQPVIIAKPVRLAQEIVAGLLKSRDRTELIGAPLHVGMPGFPVIRARALRFENRVSLVKSCGFHIDDELRVFVFRRHEAGQHDPDLVGENLVALIVDHAAAVAVTIKSQADICARCEHRIAHGVMPKNLKADVVLVDGSSYLYRAYHALPNLTNSQGDATGALHGVLSMINKLVREQPTSHVAVVFDAPGKTFRDDLYDEYKANRPPMPDDLRTQVQPILDAVEAMGLPLLRITGVEADDVIGTLCRQGQELGMKVLVSTGDKDIAQLVDENVTLVNTMNDTIMDPEGVRAKFDVAPEQVIDYLALVGDTSDNVPGVPKVGAKTAAKWLNQYGSVDAIIEQADDIKGKVGESLRDNLGLLELSRELVTIKTDVKLELRVDELQKSDADTEKLRAIFSRFELRSLLRQLDEVGSSGVAAEDEDEIPGGGDDAAGEYETVLDWASFDRWLKAIDGAEVVAFDTETTSLDYMQAEIVGLSMAVEPGEACYIPLAHDYPGAPDQLPRDEVLEKMRAFLEDPDKAKLGHHLKYDAHVLARHGVHLLGMRFDSMLESYVLNSVASRHDMDSLAGHYLGRKTIKYEEVAGKGVKQLTFNQIDLETAAPYAAEDADITLQLHNKLWSELSKIDSLQRIYTDIEQPLVPVLLEMEENGVLVDRQMLADQSHELSQKMLALEEQAHELAGGPFNLGSPKQLQEILFEKQGLPVIRKTPKGQPSTAEDVLAELASDYDLPRVIIDYRSVSKLKSTYTDKLPKQIQESSGRIHTSYHQAVAATGRLSSTDPNLQNIPIRTEEGRRIRQAFVAPAGHKLLAADYSQIELRIMAHLSGDAGLQDAFARELDVHSATAAEVFDSELAAVTVDQRRSAKAINFGLMYGMSAFGLAKQLDVSRVEAQEYIDLYFDRYPGVKQYMDSIRSTASEQGYVETVFGRRLYLPEINARNAQRRQYAERSAINAPMQGTAADIIKRAMLTVHDWLGASTLETRMIMQVHDELVFEVPDGEIDEVSARVVELMSSAAELSVPLKVDAGVGDNWDEAH